MFIWIIIIYYFLLLFHIIHYCCIFISLIISFPLPPFPTIFSFSLPHFPHPPCIPVIFSVICQKAQDDKMQTHFLSPRDCQLSNDLQFCHFILFLFSLISSQHPFPSFHVSLILNLRVFTISSSSSSFSFKFPQYLLHPPALLRTRKTWAPLAD